MKETQFPYAMNERTLVVLKPDTIQRSIVGKIVTRFEDAGLKIVAMRMLWADDKRGLNHYPLDDGWARSVFEKTKKVYEEKGKKFPYKTHKEHGQTIQNWLITFLREGPVIALVLEGPHAVELVRKMTGATEPRQAAPGTIRGDFATTESYTVANNKERALRNLLHASESVETAQREIAVWFEEKEIYHYPKEMDRHY